MTDSSQGSNQTSDQTEDPHLSDSVKNQPAYVARAAVCVLRLPEGAPSFFTTPEAHAMADGVQAEVEEALRADARVSEVLEQPHNLEIDNARTDRYWFVEDSIEKLTKAVFPFEGLHFNQPTIFRVRVPIKNQRTYRSMTDVPSEEYLALWDGSILIVQWKQDDARSTGSGGHVVQDVLEDLGKALKQKIEIIACARGCHHRFLHADFVSFSGDREGDNFSISGSAVIGSTVQTPFDASSDDLIVLRRTASALRGPLNLYGLAKSREGAIRYLDWRARRDTDAALSITYARASKRRVTQPLGWLADTWRLRGTRALSRELIAGLWLNLSTMETLRSDWQLTLNRLEMTLEEKGMGALGDTFDVGETFMKQQNLVIIRDAVQELASRSEGRLLFTATLAGGLSAIAGAVISAAISFATK